jgi:hypothetical protein
MTSHKEQPIPATSPRGDTERPLMCKLTYVEPYLDTNARREPLESVSTSSCLRAMEDL